MLPVNAPFSLSVLRKYAIALAVIHVQWLMLSSGQLRRLAVVLDSASSKQRDAADAIWLMLLTGCRSGEILRLRWDEVQKDRLALRRTKTGPREVNLSDAAIQYLDRLRKHRRSSYVFPARRTKQPHRISIDHAWQTFKHLAGLPDGIRLHDLRHTYASHAIMSVQMRTCRSGR